MDWLKKNKNWDKQILQKFCINLFTAYSRWI